MVRKTVKSFSFSSTHCDCLRRLEKNGKLYFSNSRAFKGPELNLQYCVLWTILKYFFLVNFAKATVQNSFKEVSLNKFQWLESSKKMDVNKFHWMGYYFQNQIIMTCKICFSTLLGSVCSSLFVDHRVSCYYIPFN